MLRWWSRARCSLRRTPLKPQIVVAEMAKHDCSVVSESFFARGHAWSASATRLSAQDGGETLSRRVSAASAGRSGHSPALQRQFTLECWRRRSCSEKWSGHEQRRRRVCSEKPKSEGAQTPTELEKLKSAANNASAELSGSKTGSVEVANGQAPPPGESSPKQAESTVVPDLDAHYSLPTLASQREGVTALGNVHAAEPEKDPHQLTKFVIKYGTAVVLFLAGMSLLRSYEEQIIEQRKREKEHGPPPPPPNISPFAPRAFPAQSAQFPNEPKDAPVDAQKAADRDQHGRQPLAQPLRIEPEPQTSLTDPISHHGGEADHAMWHMFSEIKEDDELELDVEDELLLEQATLEAKLKRLRKQVSRRDRETDALKKDIKVRLKSIEQEIERLHSAAKNDAVLSSK